MWYNATARGREGPPTILRINQVRLEAVRAASLPVLLRSVPLLAQPPA